MAAFVGLKLVPLPLLLLSLSSSETAEAGHLTMPALSAMGFRLPLLGGKLISLRHRQTIDTSSKTSAPD